MATEQNDSRFLCRCVYHRCNSEVLEGGGTGRVLPDAQTFRRHEKDERRHQLVAAAEEVRNQAMEQTRQVVSDFEEELANRMENISMTGAADTSDPSFHDAFRASRKQGLIDAMGQIKDHLEALTRVIPRLPPPFSLSDSSSLVIAREIQTLSDIQTEANRLLRDFRNLGSNFQSPAVREIRIQVTQAFKGCFDDLTVSERAWTEAKGSFECELAAQIGRRVETAEQVVYTEHHYEGVLPQLGFIATTTFMVVVCKVILGLPRRGCSWLLNMVSIVVAAAVSQALNVSELPPTFRTLIKHLPKDDRSAVRQLRLDGGYEVYAACPSCHELHRRDEALWGSAGYPLTCRFSKGRRQRKRCREVLLRRKSIRGNLVQVPIRPFISFDFKDWMGEILSRPGYEKMMDQAWKKKDLATDDIHDIFQGSILRNLSAIDGKHFSISSDGAKDRPDGRYVFSLGFDFFNPLSNKLGGKKVSVGLLVMTCLSLPIELRYRPENMFLAGIIPGPTEPSKTAINPYLKPLVDVLLLFWRGVWFSRTSEYALGRMVMAALILVVCDLVAARKICCIASHSHNAFCSRCRCMKNDPTRPDEAGINRTDYENWDPRTSENVRQSAEEYRAAPTEDEAENHFHATGIRWCELLRLPYFDPPNMLVVDPMHNLFLGLLKKHFRTILGYKPERLTSGTSKRRSRNPFGPKVYVVRFPDDLVEVLPEESGSQIQKIIDDLEGPIRIEDRARLLRNWENFTMERAVIYLANNLVPLNEQQEYRERALQAVAPARVELVEKIVDLFDRKEVEIDWERYMQPDIIDNYDTQTQNRYGTMMRVLRKLGWSGIKDKSVEPRKNLVQALQGRKKGALVCLYVNLKKDRQIPAARVKIEPPQDGSLLSPFKTNCSSLERKMAAHILFAWRSKQRESEVSFTVGCVVTDKDLEEILKDLKKMVKPSWVTPVPTSRGSAEATDGRKKTVVGKLKADQWRILGTTYLVVSLIRLWSRGDPNDAISARRREILDLTISLVSAVNVMTSRITSAGHAAEYKKHIGDYIRGLRRLFPRNDLVVNQHMAMHLHEFLTMFGPVHSWWTYPLERIVGLLQRINNNYKPGEYEETIAKGYTQRTKLRAFFLRDQVPQTLDDTLQHFQRLLETGARDTLTTDILALSDAVFENDEEQEESTEEDVILNPVPIISSASPNHLLPDAALTALLDAGMQDHTNMFCRPHFIRQGLRFSVRNVHMGNSQVLHNDTPAVIEYIIQCNSEIYVLLRQHLPADCSWDPYVEYPVIRAKLWSVRYENHLRVVKASSLESHFARCDIIWEERPVSVVISLSRTWRMSV